MTTAEDIYADLERARKSATVKLDALHTRIQDTITANRQLGWDVLSDLVDTQARLGAVTEALNTIDYYRQESDTADAPDRLTAAMKFAALERIRRLGYPGGHSTNGIANEIAYAQLTEAQRVASTLSQILSTRPF